jgi:hypothetical protein
MVSCGIVASDTQIKYGTWARATHLSCRQTAAGIQIIEPQTIKMALTTDSSSASQSR